MNIWKRISVFSFSLLFFITFLHSAYGQRVDTYQLQEFDGVFEDISFTGTPFTYVDDGSGYGSNTDEAVGLITLPFDFPYDGQVVDQGSIINASTNGCIVLRPVPYDPQSNGAWESPYMGAPGRAGVIMWALIDAGVVNTTDYYQVDGTAPNRVLTIQQNAAELQSNTLVQTKLYESSGNIEFLYLHHGIADNNGGGAAIGLQGWNTPTPDYISYYPLDPQYGWSTVQTLPARDLRWVRILPTPTELTLEPQSIDFGSQVPGTIDTMCVTATNLGPATLNINGVSLSGDASFTLLSGGPVPGDTIPLGESRSYCFQYTTPNALGVRSATFSLQTNGRDSGTQLVTMRGVAILPAIQYAAANAFHKFYVKLGDSATLYFPVTSTGAGDVTFDNISIVGLNPENYFISHYPRSPLPAGQSDSIGVTFAPIMEGRPDAAVIIRTNALNLPVDSITMFGVGILPHFVVTPTNGVGNTLAFDSVSLGDSVCASLTVSNPGTDTLRLNREITTGDPDFIFHVLTGSDAVILPNETKLLNVCFKPLQQGTRLATIRFYTNIPLTFEHPRRDTSQFEVYVTGTGVPAGILSVSGKLIDSAEVGKQLCVTDTIRNTGSASITVTNVTVAGANSSDFELSGISPLPFVLAPGETRIVTICFTPGGHGLRTANLVVTGASIGRELSQTIPLTGYGLQICATATPSPAPFGANGKTLVSKSDTTTITVTNCGDITTTYTATANPSAYTLISPATSSSVAPNGTASFTVVFAPTAVGATPGTLMIAGGPGDTIALNGVGGGVSATGAGEADSVVKGNCETFTVTITNTGNEDWILNTASITGTNASDFTIMSGPTPDTLAPGAMATVTLKFCPSSVGAESATLSFPTSSPSPVGGFTYGLTGNGTQSGGVSEKTSESGYSLGQSYPNPTTGTAEVFVTLPVDAPIEIVLMDAKGNIVRTEYTGRLTAGDHSITLDATNLPSGTYYYELSSGSIRLTRHLTLLR